MNAVLVAYLGTVTAAILIGASLGRLLSARPSTTRYALAFSAGVMLAVCLLYLIPDALAFQHDIIRRSGDGDHASIGYSLSIGFFSLLTIERYLLRAHHHAGAPQGEQGGHDCAHDHEPPHHHQHNSLRQTHDLGVAWSTVVALWLHGLFDGVALYAAGAMPQMGTALASAIVLHKVPETATLLSVMRGGGVVPGQRRAALLVYMLATPLGTLAAAQLLTLVSKNGVAMLMAFVAGSLLHLVTGHLLPEVTQHGEDRESHIAYAVMLLGFATLLLARLLGGS